MIEQNAMHYNHRKKEKKKLAESANLKHSHAY